MALGTEWCTVDEVKALLGEPLPDDADITLAIEGATMALEAQFCVTPLDVDPEDTYPDDFHVRRACAILAAQVLTAQPMSGGAEEGITQESMGGYSYSTQTSTRTAATALRIDGAVKELVGGYLCDGYSGLLQLDTLQDKTKSGSIDPDDPWWEED